MLEVLYSGGTRHFSGALDEPESFEGKDLCPECGENWKQPDSARCRPCHLLQATQSRELRRDVKRRAHRTMTACLRWLAEQGRQRESHELWLKRHT